MAIYSLQPCLSTCHSKANGEELRLLQFLFIKIILSNLLQNLFQSKNAGPAHQLGGGRTQGSQESWVPVLRTHKALVTGLLSSGIPGFAPDSHRTGVFPP